MSKKIDNRIRIVMVSLSAEEIVNGKKNSDYNIKDT